MNTRVYDKWLRLRAQLRENSFRNFTDRLTFQFQFSQIIFIDSINQNSN